MSSPEPESYVEYAKKAKAALERITTLAQRWKDSSPELTIPQAGEQILDIYQEEMGGEGP